MAGRPKANIDWQNVEKMIEAGCTTEGIAATIGVQRDTLYKRCQTDNKVDFSTFCRQKKAQGDEKLRMKQFQTALDGNVTMQIWLGKQRLGQRDKVEQDLNPRDDDTIQRQVAAIKKLAELGGQLPLNLFRDTIANAARMGLAIRPEIQSGVMKALQGMDSSAIKE